MKTVLNGRKKEIQMTKDEESIIRKDEVLTSGKKTNYM